MLSAPSPYNVAEKDRRASRRPRRPLPRTALLFCSMPISRRPPPSPPPPPSEPGGCRLPPSPPEAQDQAPPCLVLLRLHNLVAAGVAYAPLNYAEATHTPGTSQVLALDPKTTTATPKFHDKTQKRRIQRGAQIKVGSTPPQTPPPAPYARHPSKHHQALLSNADPRPSRNTGGQARKKYPMPCRLTGLLGLLLAAAARGVDRERRRGVLDRGRYVDRDLLGPRSVGARVAAAEALFLAERGRREVA